MISVNFMNSSYLDKIECDKPQRDGYELANLIEQIKQSDSIPGPINGFVVDTFVRTPVNIKIFFKINFKLDQVLIDSKVNRHESCGFQILTSIDRREQPHFRRVSQLTTNTDRQCHDYVFEHRKPNQIDSRPANRAYFGACPRAYTDNISAMSIIITRTLNSTSACIKSLKIIGIIPECMAHKPILDRMQPVSTDPTEIPDEYLDDLTNDLMSVPIKLPSGKSIDKSTLDTFIQIKRENGDFKETDPFTGMEFSSTSKWKINDELKAQINYFRLRHGFFIDQRQPYVDVKETLKRKLNAGRLDELLQSTEGPSTKRRLTDTHVDAPLQKCSCCQNLNQNLYEIETCKHAYCRHCLISMVNACVLCKTSFTGKQVVHFYREKFYKQNSNNNNSTACNL